MNRFFLLAGCGFILSSCSNADETNSGKFTLNGTYKNAADQKVYLEQIIFTQKETLKLDSAELKNGKFSLAANAAEQGLYFLRMGTDSSEFLFVNDAKVVSFDGDKNNQTLDGSAFDGPANARLKKFITDADSLLREFVTLKGEFEQMNRNNAPDNIKGLQVQKLMGIEQQRNNYFKSVIDTTGSPAVALYAVSLARRWNMNILDVEKEIRNLAGRFSGNQGIVNYVNEFNKMLANYRKNQQQQQGSMPVVGQMAPDFTQNDVNGKPVSLSSFKGKYVLVDFWASWCGPCRGENPNVVEAYNKYKDKNFTVLGVSLDKDKDKWIKAIADDKLTWTQVSDLQYWNNAVARQYGIESIPYNLLIDPQGKIIATELRQSALHEKLAEVLK